MATAELERGHEPTILPYPGPRVWKELVTSRVLRRRIKTASFVSVRYRSGPDWFGHVAVSKDEVLRQLDRYPVEAMHYLETDRNGIVLGA